jgi:hypothetical protein
MPSTQPKPTPTQRLAVTTTARPQRVSEANAVAGARASTRSSVLCVLRSCICAAVSRERKPIASQARWRRRGTMLRQRTQPQDATQAAHLDLVRDTDAEDVRHHVAAARGGHGGQAERDAHGRLDGVARKNLGVQAEAVSE